MKIIHENRSERECLTVGIIRNSFNKEWYHVKWVIYTPDGKEEFWKESAMLTREQVKGMTKLLTLSDEQIEEVRGAIRDEEANRSIPL